MKKADEYNIQEVDWSSEVSKDFVYYFKLKNAVQPKVRYVYTIDCNSGGHVTRSVFVTFTASMFFAVSLGYFCFSYFDYESLFLLSG